MRILLINKFLYPNGGDAISTLTTGDILKAHGHQVIFWGMDHPDNPEYPFKELFVSCIDYNAESTFFQKAVTGLKILYSFEARKKIALLLKKIKPDIVHLNNFAHQITPSILDEIKKYNIPTVMTMCDYKMVCPSYTMLCKGQPCELCRHGRYYFCAINRCTKQSLMRSSLNMVEMYLHHRILHIYNKIDIYISPSCFLKEKVKEMGMKNHTEYLSNCVYVENFQPAYEYKEKSIVYVGRLSREKGIATLIKAVKGLNIKLKIIGDGPEARFLYATAMDEKAYNVEFFGYQTGESLTREVKNSMFLVTPSECYENNPRTVIEAFAMGKPVVGARIGGIPELVKDRETGFTFVPGNTADLREKIELMIKSDDLIFDMGRNARKYAEQKLNADIHYKKLMKIYEKALNKNR